MLEDKTVDGQEEKWIFDVCGTLFYSNTTFDFLSYLFEKIDAKRLKKLIEIRKKNNLMFLFRALVFKLIKVDLFKRKAVFLLKGLKEKDIHCNAIAFYNEKLAHSKIEDAFHLLANQKGRSILVSNSIDPIVRVIAQQLDVPYFATEIEIINGLFTGRIKNDLFGKKHKKIADEDIHYFSVVTDNESDYELVKRAKTRYVVIKNNSDKKYWKDLDPNFISV